MRRLFEHVDKTVSTQRYEGRVQRTGFRVSKSPRGERTIPKILRN
jgi:hypothetical protein